MLARRLFLEDFRSYASLDLELAPGVTVLVGPNGVGKTNVLEALVLLAWGSSPRAVDDRDLVRWGAPHARVRAEVARLEGDPAPTRMPSDSAREGGARDDGHSRSSPGQRRLEAMLFVTAEGERRRQKRFWVDGAAKRQPELAGELRVVAFFPEEVSLLCEAPAARRRYLDALIGQVDRRYRRDVLDLRRVLEQRNALLRRAREEGFVPSDEELAFWDLELTRLGGAVASRRGRVTAEVAPFFATAHARLAGATREINASYACQVEHGPPEEMSAAYQQLLRTRRQQEVWQGATLVGPHRDDLKISSAGRALPTYASRGEQRTAVIALKLAEAAWIVEQTAEQPLFLLDDVLSELDPGRRERLISEVPGSAQTLLTASAPGALPASLLRSGGTRLDVVPGEVHAASR